MKEFESNRETQTATQTAADRARRRYSTVWPFFIVLMTLIYSTGRDVVTLYKHTAAISRENDQAIEPLKKAGEQAVFVDSLKTDLQKLAITDPVAAQIVSDFFPAPPPPPKPLPFPSPTPSVTVPKLVVPGVTPSPVPQKAGSQNSDALKTPPK